MILYHKSNCSTSLAALKLLKEQGINPEIREYMKQPLSKEEIKALLQKLNLKAEEIIRKKETVYKELLANKKLSQAQIINAIVKYPVLLERPILQVNDKAVIGRPIEKILELINQE